MRLRALAARALTLAALALASTMARAADTEWWVLAAQLDSGDRVLVEFTLTNLGPGERNAAAIGRWLAKDGGAAEFSRAKLDGDWTPSADGRRIDLGKFVFDRTRPGAQLRVEKASLRIALDFPLAAAPLATRKLAGGKWTQELWAASAPVEATLWKKGLSAPIRSAGRVGLSRRLIQGSESKLAQRRLELFTLGAQPVYALELAHGARAERWVVALSPSGGVIAQDAPLVEPRGALSAPSPLALAGPAVSGSVSGGTRLAAYDPLADVPALIRMALGLRLQSQWLAAPFALERRSGETRAPLSGTAIASYTFYK